MRSPLPCLPVQCSTQPPPTPPSSTPPVARMRVVVALRHLCRSRRHADATSSALVRSTLRPYSSSIPTADTHNTNKKPAISQKVKFVDQLRVVARGGQGGGGSSALFGRTGHHPRAAGGNGAPGGSVVLRATRQLTGLGSIPLHVEAERGGHGGKQWMQGKRGADKVVPVPLGTVVWQLVQLRGAEADRPHGVTPLPSHPPPHMQQQPQQQEPASEDATSHHDSSSSSSTGSQHRRRLFSDSLMAPQLAAGGHADAGVSSDSSSTAWQESASAGTASVGSAADDAHSDHAASCDQLFEQLVQGRRLLSNREKLQLLHCGSPDVNWEEDSEVADSDDSSGSESEEDYSEAEDGFWEVAQQDHQQLQAGSDWAGLGEHGERPAHHLDKQQVWSVLSAQAQLLGVLESEGQELVVATGGRGGRGNAVAPSNHHRPASKVRSDGQPGQEVLLSLQLRLMADVVLVGLPNVGKSSLTAALTGARAQVGSYAFTTLRPQLGALLPMLPDELAAAEAQQQTAALPADPGSAGNSAAALAAAAAAGRAAEAGLTGHQLVLADLPGLVPGAHAGKGRGIDFLKHLHKARCIALVVDLTGTQQQGQHTRADGSSTAGQQQAGFCEVPYSPEQQLEILMEELRCYDAKTLAMPMLVVANKADALSPEEAAAVLQRLKTATDLPIVPVSAQQHLGLARLQQCLEALAASV